LNLNFFPISIKKSDFIVGITTGNKGNLI